MRKPCPSSSNAGQTSFLSAALLSCRGSSKNECTPNKGAQARRSGFRRVWTTGRRTGQCQQAPGSRDHAWSPSRTDPRAKTPAAPMPGRPARNPALPACSNPLQHLALAGSIQHAPIANTARLAPNPGHRAQRCTQTSTVRSEAFAIQRAGPQEVGQAGHRPRGTTVRHSDGHFMPAAKAVRQKHAGPRPPLAQPTTGVSSNTASAQSAWAAPIHRPTGVGTGPLGARDRVRGECGILRASPPGSRTTANPVSIGRKRRRMKQLTRHCRLNDSPSVRSDGFEFLTPCLANRNTHNNTRKAQEPGTTPASWALGGTRSSKRRVINSARGCCH